MADVNQYRHADGALQAAYAGSALDERLAADDAWALLDADGEPATEPDDTPDAPQKRATPVARVYRHEDGREQGCYEGTELDLLLSRDPKWVPVERLKDAPPAEAEVPVDVEITGHALEKLKRPQLDQLAREHGVPDPDALDNKQAVIDAILASIQPADPDPEEGDA